MKARLPCLSAAALLFASISARAEDVDQGRTSAPSAATSSAEPILSLASFCGDRTGRADCGPDIQRWFDAVMASGICGFVPAGRYRSVRAITVDITRAAERGLCIYGAGQNASTFDLTAVKASPAMAFIAQGGTFYTYMHDWGVIGNTPGTLLQIGKTDFSDAWNTITLDRINVSNAGQSPDAVAMQINFVLNAKLDLTVNGSGSGNPRYASAPGFGTALQIRQLQFSQAKISAANARVAMQVTGGAVYSNTFAGLDLEEAETGLLIDGASVANNHFSGTIVATHPIRATAGFGNIMSDFSPGVYAGGALINDSPVGLMLLQSGEQGIPSPAFPDSGQSFLNRTGRPYVIYAAGPGLRSLSIKKSYGSTFDIPGVNGVATTTLVLNPMDSVTATWSAARPVWRFVPMD